MRVSRAVAVALSDAGLAEAVGLDVGDGEMIVTGGDGVDRGLVAARLCVALWGEGLVGRVESATQRSADAVRVAVTER